jgi:hypothetical protein
MRTLNACTESVKFDSPKQWILRSRSLLHVAPTPLNPEP